MNSNKESSSRNTPSPVNDVARPPPIEVLAAEGFAQQPETMPRLPSNRVSSPFQLSSPTSSLISLSSMNIARRSPTASPFCMPEVQEPDAKLLQKTSQRDTASPPSTSQARSRPPEEIARTVTKRDIKSPKLSTLAASGEAILRQCNASSITGKQSEQRVGHTESKSKPGSRESASLGPTSGQAKQVRPVLRLPLQPRDKNAPSVLSPRSFAAMSPMASAQQPLTRVSTMISKDDRNKHAAQRRVVPARLIAVDDQTSIPREFHSTMKKLGEQASGMMSHGGQHRLGFKSTGSPVLRHRPPSQ